MKGIELVKEMHDMLKELSQKVDILDRNVKDLMNQRVATASVPSISAAPIDPEEEKIFDFNSAPGAVRRSKTIKVFGFVQRSGGMPIPNVMITVWNDKDEEVMKRITSKNGYWECRLPVGRYGIEYSGQGVRTINKTITLTSDMEHLEVV